MRTSQPSAQPRRLTSVKLVAIGLLFVSVRIVSGHLSALLLKQFSISSSGLMGQETLQSAAAHLNHNAHLL